MCLHLPRYLPRSGLLVFAALTLIFLFLASNAEAGPLRMQSEVTDCDPQLITEPNDGSEIIGTSCDDLIVADSETTAIDGGDGNDLIIGSDSVESLAAGLGDDTIYVNGAAETFGGADDDVIYGDQAPDPESKAGAALSDAMEPFRDAIGRKVVDSAVATALEFQGQGGMAPNYVGTPTNGNDVIYGESGNDTVYAMAGNDRVYGNIGDDELHGQDGDDLLAGGHGADRLYGNDGNDTVRGDGTLDHMFGGLGNDTLSFASGVTPGFDRGLPKKYDNFPGKEGERGVYVNLAESIGDNGWAGHGGGNDSFNPDKPNEGGHIENFENVIGTPFSDYIVGDSHANVIDGGGGADVILGAGGDDAIFAGAGGDNVDGGTGTNTINGGPGVDYCVNASTFAGCNESGASAGAVIDRDTSKVAVGFIAPDRTGTFPTKYLEIYVKGSTGPDDMTLTYTHNASSSDTLKVVLDSGTFDTSGSETTGGCDYSNANAATKRVVCSFDRILDMVVVAGLGGNDKLTLTQTGFPQGTNVILLGGPGGDVIKGSDTGYDMLVDGPGNDNLQGFGLDDGLINNGGEDSLYAGAGSDLLLSTTLCEGDYIGGGGSTNQHNNASWAKLSDGYPTGVGASLTAETFGERSGSGPSCGKNWQLGDLVSIQNLEGSKFRDALVGDGTANKFLGRNMGDWLNGMAGNDTLTGWSKKNSGSASDDGDVFTGGSGNDTIHARDAYPDVSADCGSGASDAAYLDKISIDNFIPQGCELVQRADP